MFPPPLRNSPSLCSLPAAQLTKLPGFPLFSQDFTAHVPTFFSLVGKKKGNAVKRLEFAEPEATDSRPAKRRKAKKKQGSPKKRKRLAQRKSAAKRRSVRSKAKKRSEDDEEPRLDSVFLCWFLDEEEELSELGYDELRVPFVNEIVRFTQLEKVSRILRERLRSALLSVLSPNLVY